MFRSWTTFSSYFKQDKRVYEHVPVSFISCQLLSVLSEYTCLSSAAWGHVQHSRSSWATCWLGWASRLLGIFCCKMLSPVHGIAFHSLPSSPVCWVVRATNRHKSPELPVGSLARGIRSPLPRGEKESMWSSQFNLIMRLQRRPVA